MTQLDQWVGIHPFAITISDKIVPDLEKIDLRIKNFRDLIKTMYQRQATLTKAQSLLSPVASPLFLTLFLLSLSLVTPVHAASWIKAKVKPTAGAKVYQEPKSSSKALGVYPKNTAMVISDQKKNGFYAIDLKRAWNGVRYLWIAETDVEIDPNFASSSRSIASQSSTSEFILQRKNPAKPWALEPALGYSSVLIQQTRFPNNSVTFLTGQLAFSYQLFSAWEAAAQVTSTLTSFSSTQKQYPVQFLSGDARIGYRFFWGRVLVNLALGGYFSNFMSSNTSYGYNPFFNPEMMPRVTVGLGNKFAVFAWGRYIPDLSNSFAPLEITWSGGASYDISPGHPVSLFFTSSNLTSGILTSNGIQTSSTLIGASYSL